MGEKVFKKIQLVGCSPVSYEKAIAAALAKAEESLHGMSWFEVVEFRGAINDGKVIEYQATVEVGFKVD
jgi:dodecin